jgi:hypothetical protein
VTTAPSGRAALVRDRHFAAALLLATCADDQTELIWTSIFGPNACGSPSTISARRAGPWHVAVLAAQQRSCRAHILDGVFDPAGIALADDAVALAFTRLEGNQIFFTLQLDDLKKKGRDLLAAPLSIESDAVNYAAPGPPRVGTWYPLRSLRLSSLFAAASPTNCSFFASHFNS